DIAKELSFKSSNINVYEYYSNDKNLKLEEIVYYIKNNFNEKLSQTEIANQLYMSNSRFSKLFKQYVGRTFSDYILKLRIEAAQELLKHTSLKIYEVAKEVGYEESRYFSQIFKEKIGVTPVAYRENCGREE